MNTTQTALNDINEELSEPTTSPIPQGVRLMPVQPQPQTVATAPSATVMPPRMTLPQMPGLQPQRPWWYPLALVGIPSVSACVLGLAIVVSSNSDGAIQRASMEGMAAVSLEASRQRTNFTCISWNCDKFADAVQQQQQPRSQTVQGSALNVSWGEPQYPVVQVPQQTNLLNERGQVVNTIPVGDRLEVLQQSEQWAQVRWVESNLVGFIQAGGM